MKFLPLVMTRGPLLAEAIRGAAGGSRNRGLCGWCGAQMHAPRVDTTKAVRCPACARLQPVIAQEEAPWHLTPSAVEALRRTRTWLRRL